MSEWKTCAIGELVTLRQGFAINAKSKHYISKEPTSLALLRIADMKSGSREIYVKEDIPKNFIALPQDIVYTRTGNVGLVFRNNYGVVHNNCFTVTPNDERTLSRDFLYYLLQSKSFYEKANSLARGAAQPDLPHSLFNSIEISYPELKCQQRIASILSRYDSLIENYQKQIKLLEEAAQRLYKEWFVDLHFPDHENTKIVNGVPEGWEKKRIKDFVELQSGYAFKSSTFEEGCPYKIVTIKNVKDGVFEGENVSTVRTVPEKMPNHCFLKDGDILLSLTGNVGRVCMVIGENYLLNQRVAKLKTDYPVYTYSLFRSHEMFITVSNLANGAAQQNVSPIRIGDIDIVMANDELMKKFERVAGAYVDEIIKHHRQIRLLTEARDRLLPKLMSGEIAV
jgi:type I restriction enzyme S subunit